MARASCSVDPFPASIFYLGSVTLFFPLYLYESETLFHSKSKCFINYFSFVSYGIIKWKKSPRFVIIFTYIKLEKLYVKVVFLIWGFSTWRLFNRVVQSWCTQYSCSVVVQSSPESCLVEAMHLMEVGVYTCLGISQF